MEIRGGGFAEEDQEEGPEGWDTGCDDDDVHFDARGGGRMLALERMRR